MGLLLWAVGRVAALAFLCATAASVACGLFYLADLAEEHTARARQLLRVGTQAVLALHVVLLADWTLPWTHVLLSAACHGVYLSLLPSFPYVRFSSPQFLGSVAALGVAHYAWFSMFLGGGEDVVVTMGFFLVFVWAAPFGFFISLASTDDALPGALTGTQGRGGNVFKQLWAAVQARAPGGGGKLAD